MRIRIGIPIYVYTTYPVVVARYVVGGTRTPVLLAIIPGVGGKGVEGNYHQADEPHSDRKHC